MNEQIELLIEEMEFDCKEYKRTYNLNYRHNRDFYNKILNKLGGRDD